MKTLTPTERLEAVEKEMDALNLTIESKAHKPSDMAKMNLLEEDYLIAKAAVSMERIKAKMVANRERKAA